MGGPAGKAKAAKTPLHLLPPAALEKISWAMKEGADKYGAADWRRSGIDAAAYIGAMMRHLQAWAAGEDLDASGNHHLAHVAAGAMVVLDAIHTGCLRDDRPYAEDNHE
jgi:hypothetical protein